jgi:pyridoxine 4-dehydrogenase
MHPHSAALDRSGCRLPQVPFEDQVGEMQTLKDEGKIVAIGLNEVTVDQIVAAREIADIATVQNQ